MLQRCVPASLRAAPQPALCTPLLPPLLPLWPPSCAQAPLPLRAPARQRVPAPLCLLKPP